MKHRYYIQHWNQPEEKISSLLYGCYWNPSRGNVRIGKREVKWYNMFNYER